MPRAQHLHLASAAEVLVISGRILPPETPDFQIEPIDVSACEVISFDEVRRRRQPPPLWLPEPA
jgi:hypothetical protein